MRQLRKENELSQEKFGDLCGVSKGMVSQWESDLVTPPVDRIILLRRHINFSTDWLLFGENLEYSKIDQIAIGIAHQLSAEERKVWYRIGDKLAEPQEDNNNSAKPSNNYNHK